MDRLGRVVVFGNGKIGSVLARLLRRRWEVTVLDSDLTRSDAQRWNWPKHVSVADVVVCIVPTPSRPNGRFDLGPLQECFTVCASCPPETVMVVMSTVLPGDIQKLRCDVTHPVLYIPVLVTLTTIEQDLVSPSHWLIGCEDAYVQYAKDFLRSFSATTRYCVGTHDDVACAKILLNSFLTMKIEFANSLGDLCTTYGAHADRVTDMLRADPRVHHCYTPGLPYGGPCFPRDNWALLSCLPSFDLARTTHQRNEERITALTLTLKGPVVGFVGLGYKRGSSVLDGSVAYDIAQRHDRMGHTIMVHDPLVPPSIQPSWTWVDAPDVLHGQCDSVLMT